MSAPTVLAEPVADGDADGGRADSSDPPEIPADFALDILLALLERVADQQGTPGRRPIVWRDDGRAVVEGAVGALQMSVSIEVELDPMTGKRRAVPIRERQAEAGPRGPVRLSIGHARQGPRTSRNGRRMPH